MLLQRSIEDQEVMEYGPGLLGAGAVYASLRERGLGVKAEQARGWERVSQVEGAACRGDGGGCWSPGILGWVGAER